MSTVVLSLSALAALYAIWRVFRNYLITYDLDNLPGPPPSSFFMGKFIAVSGADVLIVDLMLEQETCASSANVRAGSALPSWPKPTVPCSESEVY